MTMRTKHPVKCSCGHIGIIKMSENDQPFSKPWESYSLEDLKGNSECSVEGFMNWETVFEKLQPVCPKCGKKLSIKNKTTKC